MAALLGIDIGTSSTKGVLTSHDGRVLAQADRPHEVSRPQPGWAEHDAEAVWWGEFCSLCRELAPQSDEPVVAVGVSGVGPAFLAADAHGDPLRPALLYGIDSRAMAEVAELTDLLGEDEIARRCSGGGAGLIGSTLGADSVGPKIAWLRRHEPDVYARTRHLFMPASFIVHRLTGAYVLDPLSASGVDPLFDLVAERWIDDWAELLAPGLPLPELAWPGEGAGRVSAEAAAATGLPEGCVVAVGTRDSYGDAMSAGLTEPGDGLLIYGSTMTVLEVTTDRGIPYLFPGTRNVTGAMATSGALSTWLAGITGADIGTLVAEAKATPAGADGLVVLPYLQGERSPLSDPDARGTLIGLTLHHTRGHLYRALLEASAYGLRHTLEALGSERLTHVRAVGGGLRGGLWAQVISDVTGLTQHLTAQSAGACYGDAKLAGLAAGVTGRDDPWTQIVGTVEPDPSARGTYDALYAVYRDLHPATVDLQHRLSSHQRERTR